MLGNANSETEAPEDVFPLLECDNFILHSIITKCLGPLPDLPEFQRIHGPANFGEAEIKQLYVWLEMHLKTLLDVSPSLFLQIISLDPRFSRLVQFYNSTHVTQIAGDDDTNLELLELPNGFGSLHYRRLVFLLSRQGQQPETPHPFGTLEITSFPTRFHFTLAAGLADTHPFHANLLSDLPALRSLSQIRPLIRQNPIDSLIALVASDYRTSGEMLAVAKEELSAFIASDSTGCESEPNESSEWRWLFAKSVTTDWAAAADCGLDSLVKGFERLCVVLPAIRAFHERFALDVLGSKAMQRLLREPKLRVLSMDLARTPSSTDPTLFDTLSFLAATLRSLYVRGDNQMSAMFALNGLENFTALQSLSLRADTFCWRADSDPRTSRDVLERYQENLTNLTSVRMNERGINAFDLGSSLGGLLARLPRILPNLKHYSVNNNVSFDEFAAGIGPSMEDLRVEVLAAPLWQDGHGWMPLSGGRFHAPQLTNLTRLELGLIGYHPTLDLQPLTKLVDLRLTHLDQSFERGGNNPAMRRYYGIGSAACALSVPPSLTSLHLNGLESLLPEDWSGALFPSLAKSAPRLRTLVLSSHAFLFFPAILPGVSALKSLRNLSIRGVLALAGGQDPDLPLPPPAVLAEVDRVTEAFFDSIALLPSLQVLTIEELEIATLCGQAALNFRTGGLARSPSVENFVEQAINLKAVGGPVHVPDSDEPVFNPMPADAISALREEMQTCWRTDHSRVSPNQFIPFSALSKVGVRPALTEKPDVMPLSSARWGGSAAAESYPDIAGRLRAALEKRCPRMKNVPTATEIWRTAVGVFDLEPRGPNGCREDVVAFARID